MASQMQDWELLPVEITGPIRWFDDAGGAPVLIMAETGVPTGTASKFRTVFNSIPTPALAAIDGLADPQFSLPQIVPVAPGWDIAALPGGFQIVAENFGGALTQLVTRDLGGDVVPLSEFQGKSYTRPRYMRDDFGTQVTAISEDNKFSLFDVAKGDKVPPVVLGVAQEGLLLSLGPGYLTILSTPADAHMSVLGENPGTLSIQETDRLTPLQTKPVPLFSGQSVYSFDAVFHDSLIYILAMTHAGPALHSYDLSSRQEKPLAWPTGYPTQITHGTSPTLCSGLGGVCLAFIEYEDTAPVGIRTALYA